MIDASMIPDEVVEALCNHVGPVMTRADWRAAFAAALNAWEGAVKESDQMGGNWHRLILPLPKDAADDPERE
jgi:hypothetical protein